MCTLRKRRHVVRALLDLADAEFVSLDLQPTDLVDRARLAVRDLHDAITDHGLAVHCADTQAVTMREPILLRRLVNNMVGNAVRHNVDGGWVTITTTTVSSCPTEPRAVLVVRNSGPAVAERERLVEAFHRSRSRVRARDPRGGHGLELALVDSIVTAHDGILDISAPVTGGLVVRVSLPAASMQPCS